MVDMGDPERRQQRGKIPRRTIYFASGETMEEYSTDEEEEEETVKKDVVTVDSVGCDQMFYNHFVETIRILQILKLHQVKGVFCRWCLHQSDPSLRAVKRDKASIS